MSWEWARGYRYEHYGLRGHRRPPRVLHLLPGERKEFNDLVRQNPTSTPSALVTGVPNGAGSEKSAADISPALLNRDRVAKERNKVKNQPDVGGNKFLQTFAEFDRLHPGFVVTSKIGDMTVISFQTEAMQELLVKFDLVDKPVNGIMSDATHKFFKESEAVLVMTSAYSPELQSWAPGLMSYSNGQTAEHFRLHFKTLFRNMARVAARRSMEINDKLFAGVRSNFLVFFYILTLHRLWILATPSDWDLSSHLPTSGLS